MVLFAPLSPFNARRLANFKANGRGAWSLVIFLVIFGISLFVRLAQALFRPTKVYFPCPHCALQRHDPDAVFCKACGHMLKIPDEGV